MTLMQSWVDSLSLLKPKNLKLFSLVTLKSIIEAAKIVAIYWSWLIVIITLIDQFPLHFRIEGLILIYLNFFIFKQLLIFGMCLSMRPSIEQKKCSYFRSYLGHFIYIVFALLCLFFVFVSLVFLNYGFIGIFYLSNWFFVSLWLMILPIYIFLILFFLDSRKSILNFLLAIWRAIKMFLYNLPVLILVSLFFQLCWLLWSSCFMYMKYQYILFNSYPSLMINHVLRFIITFIAICTYTNIYIQKLHSQFDLYFTSPK